ncbi:MAG: S-layer homology domain-containing protein [Oscillospiraceae bacterium]|nr:S-layer homology domain-containing protein [Oscillospiraceae bacterium]
MSILKKILFSTILISAATNTDISKAVASRFKAALIATVAKAFNKVVNKVTATLVTAAVFISAFAFAPQIVFARDGVGGFDGLGISAGEITGRTALDYQEYTFITGEPVLLKGTLTMTKAVRDDRITYQYSYRLNNSAKRFQMTREISYETELFKKDNGQTVTVTKYTRTPSEKIVTDGETYTLRTMDFTRTSLVDEKPAVSYYSGNSWYRKNYEIGGGTMTSQSGRFVTVEATGEFYGFDQYWGAADVEETDFIIEYSDFRNAQGDPDHWGGSATVRRSQSTITQLRYVENEPDAISFRGGYLETRRNDNVLEVSAKLPEFDSKGASTDKIKTYKESTKIDTFPSTKRLVSPDLRHIRGHWAEESISKLFGLEVFKDGPSQFNPSQYITRGEFAAALVGAARNTPEDPAVASSSTRNRAPATTGGGRRGQAPDPIFTDVSPEHIYFSQIEEAFNRGLMNPMSSNMFSPNGEITVADAAVTFIRAMGLESLASYHGAITNYLDDDSIPDYAREALYVCEYIGLLKGDGAGRINPSKVLTKGEAAVMLDRFVEYMREDLRKDYRDRIMDF